MDTADGDALWGFPLRELVLMRCPTCNTDIEDHSLTELYRCGQEVAKTSAGGPCECDCCDHMPDVTAFLEKFENGTFTISPPEWFGPLMVGCFKQTLDKHEAPNYLEMRIGDQEGTVYALILCRPNRPSPHQLRRDAEAEVERLRGCLAEVAQEVYESYSMEYGREIRRMIDLGGGSAQEVESTRLMIHPSPTAGSSE